MPARAGCGRPGSASGGPPRTETQYVENVDRTAGGVIPLFTSIHPAQLPLGKVNGACMPVFPHSFLKTNTIFSVARAAGLYTAWSDKHPAYEIVNGHTGQGVNDLFTPGINNANDPTVVSTAATAAYDRLKSAQRNNLPVFANPQRGEARGTLAARIGDG